MCIITVFTATIPSSIGAPHWPTTEPVPLVPVKLMFDTSALTIVTTWEAGTKLDPALDTTTVYEPGARSLTMKWPEPSAVAVAAVPTLTVAPLPAAAGLIVPDSVHLGPA